MGNTSHLKATLSELWFDNKEIDIYLSALKIGTCVTSTISSMLDLPKTTTRHSMESLAKKWLMTKSQKWNTTYFTPEHPNTLKNLLVIEKNKIEQNEHRLDNVMWDLIWLYNPHTKIPKVTFYEWIEWVQKVLEDSLNASEVIDSFVNVDDIIDNDEVNIINKKYTEHRISREAKKRSIYSSSIKTKEYLESLYSKKSLNEIKYLDSTEYNLYVSFMMYDWKISYITFKENSLIWVIIQNNDVYNFHKSIFKFMWKHL